MLAWNGKTRARIGRTRQREHAKVPGFGAKLGDSNLDHMTENVTHVEVVGCRDRLDRWQLGRPSEAAWLTSGPAHGLPTRTYPRGPFRSSAGTSQVSRLIRQVSYGIWGLLQTAKCGRAFARIACGKAISQHLSSSETILKVRRYRQGELSRRP